MRRLLTVMMMLAVVGRVWAQDDHGPEPAWTEHLVGGKLIDWQVVEGDHVADKDTITIGGKTQAKLKLLQPIGDRFSLRLEYQYNGTSPMLQWKTNQLSNWNLNSAGPNRWMEFSVSGAQGTWRRGSHWNQRTRAVDGGFSSSGGLFVGPGPMREFHIIVPANTTLTLRRLAFHTTPVTERSPYGLITALIVLGAILLGIMALGWFLNRRRAVPAPRPTVPE